MIEANKDSAFLITVSLLDDFNSELISGRSVIYDVRTINDSQLIPSISGTFDESTVEAGIYKKELSIPQAGSFICYATCSGFVTSTEDIVISEENIYNLTKENRVYNTSVIDVIRTTVSGSATPSQIARNVEIGNTDYIISEIKMESDSDWTSPVSSGISYAHYANLSDQLPYKMGGEF